MKTSFFNEQGMLNLDELVQEQMSFKKIMEDDIVTDEELEQQCNLVKELYAKVEKACSDEQVMLIKDLLAESCVLQTIYQFHELQSLK